MVLLDLLKLLAIPIGVALGCGVFFLAADLGLNGWLLIVLIVVAFWGPIWGIFALDEAREDREQEEQRRARIERGEDPDPANRARRERLERAEVEHARRVRESRECRNTE